MKTWTVVEGTDIRAGDIIRVGQRPVRVERLDPYVHPDDAVGSGRIAHYPSPHHAGDEDSIVVYDRDLLDVAR